MKARGLGRWRVLTIASEKRNRKGKAELFYYGFESVAYLQAKNWVPA